MFGGAPPGKRRGRGYPMAADLDSRHCVVLKDGKFDTANGTTANDLKLAFADLQAQGGPLVVHFHGGLVDREAGLAGAQQLPPIYTAAGAYPLFVVCGSGCREVILAPTPA